MKKYMKGLIGKKGKNDDATSTISHEARLFRDKGDSYSNQGNYNEAVVMYLAALEKAPANAELLLSLSLARMMSTPPQLALALQDVQEVIQRYPEHSEAHIRKADICERLNKLGEAEVALQRAIQLTTDMSRKMVAQGMLANVRTKQAQAQLMPNPPIMVTPPATTTAQSIPTIVTASPLASTSQNAWGMQTPAAPASSSVAVNPETPLSPQPSRPSPNTAGVASALPIPSASTASSSRGTTGQVQQRRPVATPSAPAATSSGPAVTPSTAAATPYLSPSGTETLIRPLTPPVPGTTQQDGAATTSSAFTPPIQRSHTSTNVNETPTRSVPFSHTDLFDDIPLEPPPGYSASGGSRSNLTAAQIQERITQLEQSLTVKTKGSLAIRPYTLPGNIDAVLLMYTGMARAELTQREIPTPTYLHPALAQMRVNTIDYPGNTFIDQDPETSSSYDGAFPGTVTVAGYSEEYRAHQLRIRPMFSLQLQSSVGLPKVSLDKIVARLRRVQLSPQTEDDEGLKEFLGLSQINLLQYGFHANGTRQKRIDCLCMLLARSHADEPARFVDLRKSASISGLFLAPTGNQETSTRDFLYTMLLGAELLLRLRKQPALTSYQSIMNDYTSTLIVIAVTFMANVIIQDLGHNPRGFGSSSSRYVFVAADHRRRSEALIRFGETLAWPLIEQARDYMERAYDMITRAQPVNLYLCDWLFGLVLPGKYFRHRAMSCLVLASQGSKHLGPAPYYDSGLIIAGKSYWPTRTVLGRVLGGLRRAPTQGGSVGRAVCGWLGPAPVPKDESGRAIPDGWILLFARDIDFPVPVVKSANALADLGLAEVDGGPIEDPVDVVESLTNPDEWICPTPPSRPAVSTVRFKGIRLERMPTVSAAGAGMSLFSSFGQLPTRYRPILDFDVAGASVSYVLYANPVFVAAPPCVVMHAGGGHVVHRRQALRYLAATVPVAQLKTTYPEAGKLLIINAMGGGDEELIARAWCAERGKSAVIRRNVLNQECCFACACAVASGSTGLAVDVLIWSS